MTESQPHDPQAPARAPYAEPTLEALGAWSNLTLQQSVPITPDDDPNSQQFILVQSL